MPLSRLFRFATNMARRVFGSIFLVVLNGSLILGGLFLFCILAPLVFSVIIAKRVFGRRSTGDRDDDKVWPKEINWEPLRQKVKADAEIERRASIPLLSPADPYLDIRSDGGAIFARPGEDDEALYMANSRSPEANDVLFPTSSPSNQLRSPFHSRRSSASFDLDLSPTRVRRGEDSFLFTPEEVDRMRTRRLSATSIAASSPVSARTPAGFSSQSRNVSTEFMSGGLPPSVRFGDQNSSVNWSDRTTFTVASSNGASGTASRGRESRQQTITQRNKNHSTTSLSSVPEGPSNTQFVHGAEEQSSGAEAFVKRK